MQTQRHLLASLKHILHLAVLIIMILLFVVMFYRTVFALSPSFPIQGIIMHGNDWKLNPDESTAKDITQCKEGRQDIPFPKMQAVNYYSDGKTLFATLWLSSQFKNVTPTESYRSYTFFVQPDSVYNVPQNYEVRLDWNATNNSWIKKYHEWSPIPGVDKVLYPQTSNISNPWVSQNHPGFFERGKNYVDLSMDLGAIGYPDKYSIVSYTTESFITQRALVCSLIDVSDAIHIPTPEFILSSSPSSLVLRPGEETGEQNPILVHLNSSTTLDSKVTFSTEPIDGINSTIIPKEISIPPLGEATSDLHIKALENATFQPYRFRIHADMTIPLNVTNLATGTTIGPPLSVGINKSKDFIVTVQPPLPQVEQISKSFSTQLSQNIGTYLIAIATIVSGILVWKVTRGKK